MKPSAAAAWMLLSAQLTGCSSTTPFAGGDAGAGSRSTGTQARTYVYECDKREPFTVRIEGETAWLFLPSGTIGLPRVPSASGTKFSNDRASYWGRGGEARLVLNGMNYDGCRNNRARAIWEDAKLRGADFRAVGNEPGWHLEIFDGRKVVFVHNYGRDRYEFQAPPPQTGYAKRTTRYELSDGAHRLTVMLHGRPCSDSMSGESFQAEVTLVFDGKRLSGCGSALH